MANVTAQNDDKWLKKGDNTFVSPVGSGEVAWQGNQNENFGVHNPSGQTVSQGTFEKVYGDGSAYAVYDGGQNYRGYFTGNGDIYSKDGSANDVIQAAYNEALAKGAALDGTTTAADYEARVAANKQAARDEYNNSGSDDEPNYLDELYSAQERAAVNALKGAYNSSIADLDAAKEKIPGAYYSAENSVAGDNARQSQNMNEQFAALGLNTGARGQAAVAQSNVYQGNISELENSKASALADIELQRTKLTAEYKSAVAEAIANNEMAKAQALYNEYVRQDTAAQSAAANIQSMQASATKANQSLAQAQVDAILKAGQMPSADLIAASGYDASYIQALLASQNVATGSVSKAAAANTNGDERTYQRVYNQIASGNYNGASIATMISSAALSDAQKDKLLTLAGY